MAERTHDQATSSERPPQPAHASRSSTPAIPNSGGVLALEVLMVHGQAGNAAVGRLIARADLQRQPPAAPPAGASGATETKGGDKAAGPEYTMTVAGVGTFPLLSFQLSGGEVVVTKYTDEHSAKLMQLAAEGRSLGEVTITAPGQTIKIMNAVISSFQSGGGGGDKPTDTFSINGPIEHETGSGASDGGAGGGGGREPGYPG